MRPNIQSLTGLRGLAACYVAFYHVHGQTIHPSSALGPFTRHGYIAVDMFFVLSGYVMALSYRHMFEKWSWRRYSLFMTRRAARIYPLYFVLTCVLMVGLNVGIGTRPSAPSIDAAFLYNLLLVQNWGLSYSIIIASWSISTELAAYIVFPLLLAIAFRSRPIFACATALASVGALFIVSLIHYELPNHGPLDVFFDFSPWPMVRCLSEFTIGLVAFRISVDLKGRILPTPLRPPISSPILLGLAAALLFWPGTDLVLITIFASLIVTIALDERPVRFWLATPMVVLLGELSYAIYLLHWEFLRLYQVKPFLETFLGTLGAKIAADIFYFVLLFVSAWLCFTFIEKPGRRLIRRWARSFEVAA